MQLWLSCCEKYASHIYYIVVLLVYGAGGVYPEQGGPLALV